MGFNVRTLKVLKTDVFLHLSSLCEPKPLRSGASLPNGFKDCPS